MEPTQLTSRKEGATTTATNNTHPSLTTSLSSSISIPSSTLIQLTQVIHWHANGLSTVTVGELTTIPCTSSTTTMTIQSIEYVVSKSPASWAAARRKHKAKRCFVVVVMVVVVVVVAINQ
jgi:hypothetical protein